MTVLHVKSPNGTQTDLDLSKIVLTDTDQSISGKTFDNVIRFDTLGEIGIRTMSHEEEARACRQLILTTTNIDDWSDAGAKIALHYYDDTGTNDLEDGKVLLVASNGTTRSELNVGYDLSWHNINIGISYIGNNYIRYENGIQICWDDLNSISLPNDVIYPMPFIDMPRIGICNGLVQFTSWDYTGCRIISTRGSSSAWVRYIAIGRWR